MTSDTPKPRTGERCWCGVYHPPKPTPPVGETGPELQDYEKWHACPRCGVALPPDRKDIREAYQRGVEAGRAEMRERAAKAIKGWRELGPVAPEAKAEMRGHNRAVALCLAAVEILPLTPSPDAPAQEQEKNRG